MINAQHIYTSMVYNIGSLWRCLYWNHSLNYNILVIYNWTVVCGLICWEKLWSQQLFIFQLKRSVNLYEKKKIGKCIKHEPRSWCKLSVTLAVFSYGKDCIIRDLTIFSEHRLFQFYKPLPKTHKVGHEAASLAHLTKIPKKLYL